MFKDKLKADLDKLSPDNETKAAILENIQNEAPKKAKILNLKATSVIAACLALVIALGVAINTNFFNFENEKVDKNNSSETESNYDIVYSAVEKNYEENKNGFFDGFFDGFSDYSDYGVKTKSENYAITPETKGSPDDSEYSNTNTREENVDEDDIIKTDGKYIYRLSDYDRAVKIYKANGKQTEKISKIDFDSYIEVPDIYDEDEEDYYFYEGNAHGMYLVKNKLVLICDGYDKILSKECDCNYCKNKNYEDFTIVLIYDISNPKNPKFDKSFKQTGYFDSSRMIGNKLYISSNYYISSDRKINKNEKTRYLPILCDGEKQTIQNEKSICVSDDMSDTSYTVICSYDIENLNRIDDLSVFGSSSLNYVSENNMYFTESIYKITYGNTKVLLDSVAESTKITRFSINDGKIEKSATGNVKGELLNEFSLDENNGYLRLVLTQNRYGEDSDKTYNSLVILDMDLKEVSSIEKLAKGERIYSARFMSDYAYFVTFKETDPLFCADISNPRNPEIVSKLKIPGFSNYLHPFSNNKLFGFGQSATDDGEVTGLKLSMFDISDKKNVTEESVIEIDADYSTAFYDHKSILVSSEKNLIGFHAEKHEFDEEYDEFEEESKEYYYIYSYDENKGFVQKAKIDLNADDDYSDARGLYIDDYFYISTENQLLVLDLKTLKEIKTVR